MDRGSQSQVKSTVYDGFEFRSDQFRVVQFSSDGVSMHCEAARRLRAQEPSAEASIYGWIHPKMEFGAPVYGRLYWDAGPDPNMDRDASYLWTMRLFFGTHPLDWGGRRRIELEDCDCFLTPACVCHLRYLHQIFCCQLSGLAVLAILEQPSILAFYPGALGLAHCDLDKFDLVALRVDPPASSPRDLQ